MTLSTIGGGQLGPAVNPFDIHGGGRVAQAQQLPARSDQFERMGKWLELFMGTAEVAKVLARTAFVPDPMRGQPEDIAAAMMKGLELGIDPLDALANMHVVKGKIGFSAEFMRRRIIEAGHEIEFDETTDERCKMRGRRAGAEKWQTVTFTAENARKAKIQLGDYPADKLVARASSRMCRRVFPEVLAGAAIIEDIIDGEVVEGTYEAAPAAPSGQTALQRKPRKSSKPAPEPQPEPQPEPPSGDLDQFPGVEEATPAEPEPADLLGDESGYDTPDPSDEPPITKPQLQKLSILRQREGYTDDDQGRADWFQWVQVNIGRLVGTNKDLTKAEASVLIDVLEPAEGDAQ